MTTAPVSTSAGRLLTVPFAVLKRFRPHRPNHSAGVGLEGTLIRTGGGTSGVRWIDEPGRDPVRARFSRSVGLPHGWPDILGLALRICAAEDGSATRTGSAGRSSDRDAPGGKDLDRGEDVPAAEGGVQPSGERTPEHDHAGENSAPVAGGDVQPSGGDLLLATAGAGRLARFAPTFHRHVPGTVFASLMPYRGTRGPVLVAAHPEPRLHPLDARPEPFRISVAAQPWALGLYWAEPTGPWRRSGTVELHPGAPFDDTERFDPLRNVPAGAENYAWTHRLRELSYALARTSRRRWRRGRTPGTGRARTRGPA